MIDHPFSREAPPELVRRLRDVDPTLRILYWGQGRWRVGRVRPTIERTVAGTRMLRDLFSYALQGRVDEEHWYRNLRWSHLIREGFAPLAEYRIQGEPTAAIALSVGRAIFECDRDAGNQKLREIEAQDRNPRQAAEAALGDPDLAKEASRMLRQPVSVTSPGMPHAA